MKFERYRFYLDLDGKSYIEGLTIKQEETASAFAICDATKYIAPRFEPDAIIPSNRICFISKSRVLLYYSLENNENDEQ